VTDRLPDGLSGPARTDAAGDSAVAAGTPSGSATEPSAVRPDVPHDEPIGAAGEPPARRELLGDEGPASGERPAVHAGAHRHAARRSGPMSLLRETAIILVCALALSWLVKTFFVQAFFIPSESMEDTLVIHDRILVNKLAPGPFDIHRGDVVVFKDPGGWLDGTQEAQPGAARSALNRALMFVGLYPQDAGEHLVKRVIGLPGDHVACAGPGQPVTVNGVALREPYVKPGSVPSEVKFDTVVPANYVWVMGDNRQHSEDSRYHMGNPGGGSVPMSNVVGVAFVTVWPFDRAGVLHNPGSTFNPVPDPTATS
jgi:signal peptidase I